MGRRIVGLAVTALLVAGCTQTSPEPRAVSTPTPAATATPEPTVAPTVKPEEASPRATISEILDRPFALNIAHAGGDLAAPHSTIFAFSEAIEAGAAVLEMDVQLSGDRTLIVQHDDTVDKTTEATGPVEELTLAQIQALDNAYWFSPECWPCQDRPEAEYIWRGVRTDDVDPPAGYSPEDFAVPTFRQVVERFPTMPLAIEIKGSYPGGFAVAQALANEIEALEITDSVVVMSFLDDVLSAFEIMAPDVETSPATNELTTWFLTNQPLDGDHRIIQVPPVFDDVPVLTPLFWDKVERDGLAVWVWPNDASSQENQAFYQELIAQGASGVIAGRPNEMAAAML